MAAAPTQPPIESPWAELLKLIAHEFRSPLTTAVGYVQMVRKEQVGPVSDQQRGILQQAEKSCGRLTDLMKEVGVLGQLEAGEVTFSRSTVDLRTLLADIIATLPELGHRTVTVELLDDGANAQVQGDASRLKDALAGVIIALRRELVTSDSMTVRVDGYRIADKQGVRITIGETVRMPRLLALTPPELGTFDEYAKWRGGNGLSLPYARRVIEAHGGLLLASPFEEGKAAAVITIPIL